MKIQNEHCKIIMDLTEASRDIWLQQRRSGIGGSDAASVLGQNRYRSSLAVAVDKKGLALLDDEENDAMKFGRRMEAPILDWFKEDYEALTGTDIWISRSPYMYQSIERPWQIANIDGVCRVAGGDLGGIEIKTHDRFIAPEYADESVPGYVYCQVQHYMSVLGLSYFYVVALVGKKLLWRKVDGNVFLFAHLNETEEEFYNQFMLTDDLPAPSGLDSDEDILKALYGVVDEEAEVMLTELSAEAEKYTMYQKQEAHVKAEKQKLRQLIESRMGTAKHAVCGDFKVTWARFNQARLDTRRLREEKPALYKDYSKTSLTTRFSVKEEG
jgi:putative phage-type endonuclease